MHNITIPLAVISLALGCSSETPPPPPAGYLITSGNTVKLVYSALTGRIVCSK